MVLARHASIGEKRGVAVRLARGAVILHWGDDDLHDPRRISAQVANLNPNPNPNLHEPRRVGAQVAPIARGEAELTVLELSLVAAMPRLEVYEKAARQVESGAGPL